MAKRPKKKDEKVIKEDVLSGVEKLDKKIDIPKLPEIDKEVKFIQIAVTQPELMKLQEEGKLVGYDGKGIATIRK